MFIDTEKNQLFLALIYSLQQNRSLAVTTPKAHGKNLLNKKVYVAYNYNTEKYFYSLQPIQNIPIKNIPQTENPIINFGGRPKILTDDQRQQVKTWKKENISNREIAKRLKISEGTIRNELSRMETDV